MTEEILLGNGAIARGLVEAGCQVVASYPGTPSSEILPEVLRFRDREELDIYLEWSVNEKVAFEVALAASWAGKRAAAVMKQVGLNVAADPFMSAAYSGAKGGLVLVSCDDPGPYSSQTEQDSRFYALFAGIPALDPASPREAKEMAKYAFSLSEIFGLPVMLRPTAQLCHARQNIELGEVERTGKKADFEKDPTRWVCLPRTRPPLRRERSAKLAKIEEEFESSGFNCRTMVDSPLGIMASGIPYASLVEILREEGLEGKVSVLKIGTPYPLPRKIVSSFIARHERILVLEETEPVMEYQIADRRKVMGRLSGAVPVAGELGPEVIYSALVPVLEQTGVAKLGWPSGEWEDLIRELEVVPRRPRLCPGCPHRSAFFAIRHSFPGAIYPSDIGCYTLGANIKAVDLAVDMGSAVSTAAGLYQAYHQDGDIPPIVATIGDSTFLHAGLPALVNSVYNGARFILVILDNGVTAMTGMQPTADSGVRADGSRGRAVPIADLVRASGVGFVKEIDPYDIEGMKSALKDAREYTRSDDGGMAVIISRRPCVLFDPTPIREHPVEVQILEECDRCRYCLSAFECPALLLGRERVEIDRRICVNCGQCVHACYKGFIVPVVDKKR